MSCCMKDHTNRHGCCCEGLSCCKGHTPNNWKCEEEDCENMVFSQEEMKREVYRTITPDFCIQHELNTDGTIRQPQNLLNAPRIWWCDYWGEGNEWPFCITQDASRHEKCRWVRLVDDPQEGGEE